MESRALRFLPQDLSGKMVRAKDGKSLVAAFENRLGDLVLPEAESCSVVG